MTKQTPLHATHAASGATFTSFYGWEMPIHYGSQVEEHKAVRTHAGMFDVSHMTIVDLLGAGGRQYLRQLLANDIDKLAHPGRALYSCMLNHDGGVIDDLIVYYRAPDSYRVVFNAGTRERALQWAQTQAEGAAVGLQTRDDFAMIAVQGPHAMRILSDVLNPEQADAIATLQPFEAVEVQEWFLARTGYTGEDGLEIALPADQAPAFWQRLADAGVQPCGLGARDTLRLECGMMLSGQDMDEQVTPLESALGWTVALEPSSRDFIGKDALMRQKQRGVTQKLVGLVLQERGIMRHGQQVNLADGRQGVITSGSFAPTLGCAVALARVPADIGDTCSVVIRNKEIPAWVTKPRFYRAGKSLIEDLGGKS